MSAMLQLQLPLVMNFTNKQLVNELKQCFQPFQWSGHTCPAVPQPDRLVHDLHTPEWWKAELT